MTTMTATDPSDTSTEDKEYLGGEFEEMDLSELRDKTFMVTISTGDRNKSKFIPESICGPFDFYKMCEVVANVYIQQQLHAKALIPSQIFGEKPLVLDENTIDFIEARYDDIIADGMLSGELFDGKEFTCKAGFAPYPTQTSGDTDED